MNEMSFAAWRAASIALGVALLLSLLGWVSLHQPAIANDEPLDALALITVETANPVINDDGLCSIIEAIENANADLLIHDDCEVGSGADIISLPADAVFIFTAAHNVVGGENALPVITSTVEIRGNDATLVRDTTVASPFRFFNVATEGSLTIRDLGMRNGRAGLTGTTQLLLGGGAVVNRGTLHIVNSNLSFNRASFGGAIYSEVVTGSLTVQNSTFSSNNADFDGGAIYNLGAGSLSGGTLRFNQAAGIGGAILLDSGTMSVTNANVLDNRAVTGAGIAARASVTNSHLSIQSTSIISNVAAVNGGGIYNSAFNDLTAHVEVEGSDIVGNRADSPNPFEGLGGGILNGWVAGTAGGVAELHVRQSSITDNIAQIGGGIANVDAIGLSTRTAEATILQSTLARNVAEGVGSEQGSGGGLYNSNGTATVANSTISGNQAVGDGEELGGRGGGIGNVGRGVTTTLQLLNSTIAFNEATQAGGGIAVLGQVTTTATTLNVGNSLVVSNALTVTQSVTNETALAMIAAPQVITGTESCSLEDGNIVSLGGNIEDGVSCSFTATTDLQNTGAMLGALADNGGPTFTHLITETGAAFNGGVDALCEAAPVNGVDQRGVSRPFGESCDVGAVELETEPVDVIDNMFFPQMYKFFTTVR